MFKRHWRYIAGLLLLIFAWGLGTQLFNDGQREKAADVFVRQNAIIDEAQRVGRLMAVDGDIAVSGQVQNGIIVVDGNLILLPGAKINGTILVLGGSFERRENVQAAAPLFVWQQGEEPLVPVLLRWFLLIGLFTAALGIAAVYGFFVWLRCSGHLLPIKTYLVNLQRQWPLLYVGAAMVVCLGMLLAFSDLAWETVFRHETEAVDGLFIWMVRYFANPGLDKSMIAVSSLGAGYLYALIVFPSLLGFMYKRYWREAGVLMLSFGGGLALNVLLKVLFERSRPALPRVVEAAGYSFPSGHAMVSLCFYGMLAFLLMRRVASFAGRVLIVTAAVVLIGAIGLSRIYLGVHYPTDVAAGYAAGATWLAFCFSFFLADEKS